MSSARSKPRRALGAGIVAAVVALTGCRDAAEPGPAPAAATADARQPAAPAPAPEPAPPERDRPASHRRMLAALAEVVARTDATNHYVGRGRLAGLRARLDAAGDRAPWQAWLETARAALDLGEERDGIALLARAHRGLADGTLAGDRDARVAIAFYLAVAWLRLAETQNCCARPGVAGCVLPIEGEGIHPDREGSEAAIRYLGEVLELTVPDSYWHRAATWLTNLAHLTLGTWPDGVAAAHRLPASAFRPAPDATFPRLRDIARDLGLDTFSLSGSVVADDFDGDGRIDLLVSTWDPRGQLRLWRNDGGRFTDVTAAAGLTGLLGGLNLVQADYDNDGDLDFLVLRGAWLFEHGRHPNSLVRNDGDGTFTDVTFDAGLGAVHMPTQAAAFADFDNDGDLDLYIGNEGTSAHPFPNQLFANRGDGTFVDVAARAGVADPSFTKAVTWGDYDDDGWIDLYVSNLGGPNRLYRNRGDGTFTDVAAELGVTGPVESFPCWFFDYDDDGDLDLYVSCYGTSISQLAAHHLGRPRDWDLARLYRNDGGRFTDVAVDAGLTCPTVPMGSNFGDLDGDGRLDFHLGTGDTHYYSLMPNATYRNVDGRRFEDIALPAGLAHLQKGHGVAFADLDHDGDLELFQQLGGAYAGDAFRDALWENPGFGHAWIRLELVGVRSNRSAIGARLRIVVRAGDATRSIHRHIGPGGGFGANPLTATVGLGPIDAIERIEIRWPRDGAIQVIDDARPGETLRVVEGESPERLARPAFRLGG